jgi:hypothetical protein
LTASNSAYAFLGLKKRNFLDHSRHLAPHASCKGRYLRSYTLHIIATFSYLLPLVYCEMITFILTFTLQLLAFLTPTFAMPHQSTLMQKRALPRNIAERQESCPNGYSMCQAFGSGCCQTGQVCCSADNINFSGESVLDFLCGAYLLIGESQDVAPKGKCSLHKFPLSHDGLIVCTVYLQIRLWVYRLEYIGLSTERWEWKRRHRLC